MIPPRLVLALAALAPLLGCVSSSSRNPAITTTADAARTELDRLNAEPKPVSRPIVILSGYRSPAILVRSLMRDVVAATSGQSADVLVVSYPLSGDIDAIAREVTLAVNERWPSARSDATIEVDVIGISMGGLVARWAALRPDQRSAARESLPERSDPCDYPRLSIARLFTFATPHRGAGMAPMGLSGAARDMMPDSQFLAALDAADSGRDYELICYAHLGDGMVGATRTAPPGLVPIWTGGTVMFSHYTTHRDPILIADLARRLRDEPPLLHPGEPPPRD